MLCLLTAEAIEWFGTASQTRRKKRTQLVFLSGQIELRPLFFSFSSPLEIVSHGKAPWQIVDTQMTLTITNTNLKTATLLDANGMKIKDVPVEKTAKGLSVKLPAEAMYLVLR